MTLTELLVVMAIIGVLIAILLPAVQAARASSRRASCANNLRQLGLSAHGHLNQHQKFPAGCDLFDVGAQTWVNASVFIRLLPYLEAASLFETLDNRQPIWHPVNSQVHSVQLPGLLCAADDNPRTEAPVVPYNNTNPAAALQPGVIAFGRTNYVACAGVGIEAEARSSRATATVYHNDGVLTQHIEIGPPQIPDGLSHTLLFGERSREITRLNGDWKFYLRWSGGGEHDAIFTCLWDINPHTTSPDAYMQHYGRFYTATSLHENGCNFAFADGSVHFLSERISSWNLTETEYRFQFVRTYRIAKRPGVFQLLGKRNDGQPIPAGSY